MPVVEEVEELSKDNTVEILGYEGKTKKVLIVDDNNSNLNLLKDVLAPLGFDIEVAEGGKVGLEKVTSFQPDLILLDYLMPDINGMEVAQNVRRSEESQHVKIIGLSATAALIGKDEVFVELCDEFITKPIDITQLYEVIQDCMGIKWKSKERIVETNPKGRKAYLSRSRNVR